jgi:hypothetical protein
MLLHLKHSSSLLPRLVKTSSLLSRVQIYACRWQHLPLTTKLLMLCCVASLLSHLVKDH